MAERKKEEPAWVTVARHDVQTSLAWALENAKKEDWMGLADACWSAARNAMRLYRYAMETRVAVAEARGK